MTLTSHTAKPPLPLSPSPSSPLPPTPVPQTPVPQTPLPPLLLPPPLPLPLPLPPPPPPLPPSPSSLQASHPSPTYLSRSLPFLLLLPLLAFIVLPSFAHASKIFIDETFEKNVTDKDTLNAFTFSSLQETAFGLSDNGILSGRLNLQFIPAASGSTIVPLSCPPTLALCPASSALVRAPSFERRHAPEGLFPMLGRLAENVCDESPQDDDPGEVQCVTKEIAEGTSDYVFRAGEDGVQGSEMYVAFGVVCGVKTCREGAPADRLKVLHFAMKGELTYENVGARFSQLGFEEDLFPVVAAVCVALMGVAVMAVAGGLVIATVRGMRVPYVLLLTGLACLLKGLTAAVTLWYFVRVAIDGVRRGWYLYARLTLSAVADVAFVMAAMTLSSGYRVLPAVWFVDGRSPIFLVYIGVTLQILIIIGVKLMFPFRFLGVLIYTLSAGVIATIIILSSLRNYSFLERYSALIKRAHIILESTPISRMQRFYAANIGIVAIVYVFKIANLGVWDYRIRRPDLMWGSLEIADAALLMWYVFSVLPRRRSAVYVDMSLVSNERLQRAETWRAGQADRGSAVPSGPPAGAAAEAVAAAEGSSQNVRAADAREGDADSAGHAAAEEGLGGASQASRSGAIPAWISWAPGLSLPRPDASTWGGYTQVARILRRERKLVPVLPSSIVIGTPCDSPDRLHLNVGMPITGPSSVPRRFDEKGIEMADSMARVSSQTETSASTSLVRQRSGDAYAEVPTTEQDRRATRRRRLGMLRRGDVGQAIGNGGVPDATAQTDVQGASAVREAVRYAPSVASSSASCDGILSNPAEEDISFR